MKALKLRKLCASFCMSVEKYRCNVNKKANKVSSIQRSILLYESIVDIDIDTSKVSSIISTSISIFDITNPGFLRPSPRSHEFKRVHFH